MWNGLCATVRTIKPTYMEHENDKNLETLVQEFIEFSINTFVKSNKYSNIIHLLDEIKEVKNEFEANNHTASKEEIIDCINCLLSSFVRVHIESGEEIETVSTSIRSEFANKLNILKSRKWQLQSNGTYKHIKDATVQVPD